MSVALHVPNQDTLEALAEGLFRPALPRLKEALSCVASHRLYQEDLRWELSRLEGRKNDGRIAWEQLAARGLIPMSWVDAQERWFRWQYRRFDPKDAAQAVLLASCAEQVVTAEALAHEVASRLLCFGIPAPKRVFWRLANRSTQDNPEEAPPVYQPWMGFYQLLFESRLNASRSEQQDALISLYVEEYMSALRTFGARHPLLRDVFFVALLEQFWELASASGWLLSNSPTLFIDETRFLPDKLVGTPFSRLPNPFSPLLSIWRLGFGCTGFAKGCIVLLCP